jgi:hypothetical protein
MLRRKLSAADGFVDMMEVIEIGLAFELSVVE